MRSNVKSHLKHIFVIIISGSFLGCAASADKSDSDSYADVNRGSDCISEGTVRDYKVLNDSNIVVTAMARQKYHLELVQRAPALRSAWSIGFASPTSRICAGFSELLVDDNFGPDRVRIRSIRRLTEQEYDDLLYRFDKAAAAKQEPPAPMPVEGADVEELD